MLPAPDDFLLGKLADEAATAVEYNHHGMCDAFRHHRLAKYEADGQFPFQLHPLVAAPVFYALVSYSRDDESQGGYVC